MCTKHKEFDPDTFNHLKFAYLALRREASKPLGLTKICEGVGRVGVGGGWGSRCE